MEEKFFNEINSTDENAWVFCDCNKPLKRYMSIGNELKIKLLTRSNKENTKNLFRIAYKFIPNLRTTVKTVQVIQDSSLSYIGGYLLHVKVPSDTNLRLFGESIRVSIF